MVKDHNFHNFFPRTPSLRYVVGLAVLGIVRNGICLILDSFIHIGFHKAGAEKILCTDNCLTSNTK